MGHEHHVFDDIEAYLKYMKLFVQYAALVLCAFIIFLSLKYVRPSLIRTYTLNICVAGLMCSSYKVTRDLLDPLLDPLLPDSNHLGNLIDSIFHVTMLFPALVLHEVQGTLLIVLTYLSFTRPLTFRHLFSRRNIWISFIVGNVVSFALGFVMYIEEISILHNLKAIQAHDIFRFSIEACLFTVMFTLYFRTLYVLVFKRCDPTNLQSRTEKRNRASLKAVLIYCTSPNVFMVLGIGASIRSMMDNMKLTEINEATRLAHGQSNILMYLAKNTIMLRLFISTICALTAFPQYRQAVMQFALFLRHPMSPQPSVITTRVFSTRSDDPEVKK